MDMEAKVIKFYYDLEHNKIKMFSSENNMKIYIEGNWVGIENASGAVIMVNLSEVKYFVIDK